MTEMEPNGLRSLGVCRFAYFDLLCLYTEVERVIESLTKETAGYWENCV